MFVFALLLCVVLYPVVLWARPRHRAEPCSLGVRTARASTRTAFPRALGRVSRAAYKQRYASLQTPVSACSLNYRIIKK